MIVMVEGRKRLDARGKPKAPRDDVGKSQLTLRDDIGSRPG